MATYEHDYDPARATCRICGRSQKAIEHFGWTCEPRHNNPELPPGMRAFESMGDVNAIHDWIERGLDADPSFATRTLQCMFIANDAWPARDPAYRGVSIHQWLAQLQDSDVEYQQEAAQAILAIGAPALPYLERFLFDDSVQQEHRGVFAGLCSRVVPELDRRRTAAWFGCARDCSRTGLFLAILTMSRQAQTQLLKINPPDVR